MWEHTEVGRSEEAGGYRRREGTGDGRTEDVSEREEEEDGADEMLSLEEMLEEAKREQAEARAGEERR